MVRPADDRRPGSRPAPPPYQAPGYREAPPPAYEPPTRAFHDPYDPYQPSPAHHDPHGPYRGGAGEFDDGERDYRYRAERARQRSARTATIVHVVTSVVVAIFVMHIVFVVAGANQGNELVALVYQLAQALVLGFGDVFTPDDAVIGVVLNYGFAALVYLLVGQLVSRALIRR